ncbi:uncharacterized protein LOC128711380, partial [Anopheles marshallii]|uniref:uncharacterized protein LOC128711380 n=1 Tax=Anopheles marshallii TaxID=1521116 RepID=UPI00237C2F8F
MERAIQDISCEEVVELQEQPATGTSERRTSVIEEPPQDGEAPPPVLPRDLEVRRRRIELQKKELKLENARKNLELENARKELDIELQEIELEEEISDHSSRGQPPLNPIATAGVMATRTAPAPLRYDDTMADDARGRQPSTPVTARFPPKYDCTWEVDQAAAQEREYMEWRRAVEDSIKVHRESKHSRPYKPEEITGANSTMESKPATQKRVLPLTPEQESARKSIPKELPAFSGDVGDDENLIRLQRALRGPALESIDHLMLLPDGLPKVIEILRTEYGRPDLIVDSLIEKVRKLPPVRTERLETLATYGKMIRKMCATIEASGLHDYECNVTLLKELVAKLPGERVLEWWTDDTLRNECDSREVQLRISGVHQGALVYDLRKAHTLQDLMLPVQALPIEKLVKLYPHLKGLPIAPYVNVTPRILIGVDNIHLGKPLRCVEGSFSEPIATKTRLGWTVFGPCCLPASVSKTAYFNLHLCVCNEEGNQNLDMALKRYFSLESIGVSAAQRLLPKEEARAITMLNTGTRLVGDRFETGLLWKYDDVRLPCNREMALKRHTCLKRKCEKNPELASAISNKMHEYADKGYIRRMSEDEIEARRERDWYLPIFPVYNPNKPGKLRMVFDAAAQVHGISLNMFLLTGPDQLVGLVQVLYKFRENRIAVTGDIREMFFQVRMNHADQRSQMVFWDDGSKQNGEPSVYAVTVMTFGAACSPGSAHFVKNLNAERFVDRFPRAVECIKYEHYVDDMLASVETVDEAVTLAEDVRLVHSKGGFEIRNWLSNSKDVVHKLRWGVNQNKCVDMSSNQGTEKVLGMWWNTDDDMLTFRINPRMDEELLAGGRLPTRREVLSTLMMIYDPLGLIGHFLMFLKILLQDLWRTGIHWDKKVEGEAAKKWLRWTGLLPELEKLMIRRCYRSITSSPCVQLHVFTDASQSGMAAVAYLRFEESGVVECALVGSKTRVAPLKLLSIPRLELQAAVIGARFADHIAKAHRLRIDKRVFWTDSRNVVSWIKSDHRRYSPFVAFRVSELSEITDANEWRWLSTKVNVADDGTKWQGHPDLTSSSRWFRGPEFLWEVEENWPINKDDPGESSEELRKSLLHHAIVRNVVDFARFSRWKKLLRTVGFVHRYVGSLRLRARREKNAAGPLTQEELLAAEHTLYIWAQLDGFAADIKRMKSGAKEKHPWKNLLKRDSVLYKLSPEIDERGILRMRGRLTNCTLLGDSLRKPVILPRRHPVTDLVIKDFHERYCHQSHRTVVGQLRTRYHIPKLLVEFYRVRRGCQHCKIRDAAPNPPLMGNIPRQRVAVNQRAFTYTGLDYFGPILVVVGRHSEKRWGALFTCLTTRAVHLELAFALTTASCILAIRRFIARRGSPREILCDRGTNFVGAARELNVALKDVDENALMSRFSGPELKWSFNPPAAPHFGGSWERLVQSVKKILCSFELPRLPTDEILMSTLTEVEMMINSRPLTYVPLDEESDSPITPNHLLLGSSDGSKPAACFDDSPTGIRTSLGALHVNAEIFWKRWIADYLPTLTRRTKWFDSVPPIKEGDVVLIVDGNLPRNTWPMGRVLEVTRARDGQ